MKVVNVLATVRNKSGSLVSNLNRDDFLLSENGRPQQIRYFARETDLPLTLGLMVDTSGSQRKVMDAERGASLRFLDQVVREKKDQVFIMQFDSVVQMRQDLTGSVGKLDDALAYVDTESMRQLRMRHGRDRGGKKDKEKNKQQQVTKQKQEEQKKHDRAPAKKRVGTA